MKEIDSIEASWNRAYMDKSKLKSFSKHVFVVRDDERLKELTESIKRNGVPESIIIHSMGGSEFDYEIVAGHKRTRGTQLAGLKSIPCDIRDIDDAAASLIMIDTNL